MEDEPCATDCSIFMLLYGVAGAEVGDEEKRESWEVGRGVEPADEGERDAKVFNTVDIGAGAGLEESVGPRFGISD